MVIIISQALNQRISSQGEFFLRGILMPGRIRDDIISTPWYSHKLHWFTAPAKWHSEVQEIASCYQNQWALWAVELMEPFLWWTSLYLFLYSFFDTNTNISSSALYPLDISMSSRPKSMTEKGWSWLGALRVLIAVAKQNIYQLSPFCFFLTNLNLLDCWDSHKLNSLLNNNVPVKFCLKATSGLKACWGEATLQLDKFNWIVYSCIGK